MSPAAKDAPIRPGFSLLELLAVAALIGVIAAIAIPRLTGPTDSARRDSCHTNKGVVETQVQLWYRNKGQWPQSNLSDIGSDPAYFPEGLPTCPFGDPAYQLDSDHHVTGHSH